MRRVLRAGGRCAVMVYYKSWWSFYICSFLRTVSRRQFRHLRNLHNIAQSSTDGAIARFYTKHQWEEVVRGLFELELLNVYGLKSDVVPLPYGKLKSFLEDLVPDRAARILTHNLRGGAFLVAQLRSSKTE